jgi:hypothetical protein
MSSFFSPTLGTVAVLMLILTSDLSAQNMPTTIPASPYGGMISAPQAPPVMAPNPNSALIGNARQQATPYSLSTEPYMPVPRAPVVQQTTVVPVPMPMVGPVGFNPYLGWGGWGGPGMGLGMALQGQASLTQATGQYWRDIQQARITREESRRSELDTARARIEFEAWYETMRPTTPKMIDRERAVELDWARKDPPKSDIWSGRSLNVLLRSILASPAPTRGPTISLEENILRGLNLTDRASSGNLALTKDEGKIYWPEAFEAAIFDEPRDRFSKNFEKAIRTSSSGEMPDRTVVRELRNDLTTLERILEQQAPELAPSRFIEARRLLNQLKDTLKGLSDPRLFKSCHNSWRSSVRNVAELVEYCMKNGLEFGPAVAAGDEPAYTAAFYALRAYERAVVPQVARQQ